MLSAFFDPTKTPGMGLWKVLLPTSYILVNKSDWRTFLNKEGSKLKCGYDCCFFSPSSHVIYLQNNHITNIPKQNLSENRNKMEQKSAYIVMHRKKWDQDLLTSHGMSPFLYEKIILFISWESENTAKGWHSAWSLYKPTIGFPQHPGKGAWGLVINTRASL